MPLPKIQSGIELSFDTISAYGPNAAMMHYEATPESYAMVKPEGMYLVDSGGQYMGGTTDVTRTIAVGEVTDEMRRSFTLVCIGMLRLADAVFLEGCTGRNLDILADCYEKTGDPGNAAKYRKMAAEWELPETV